MITSRQYADLGNGIRLHYASCGTRGRPLMLFLHGFPEYWGAWEELLPSFAATHHAVAPDLRGFNLSSQPLEVAAYRVREIVGDLERFLAHLGVDRTIVVAHDWGGAVAWQWAIARPGRVSKLVILNSPHPIPFARDLVSSPEQQRASAYINWLRAPGAEGALAKDDFIRLDEFFLGMLRTDAPWYTAARRARYHAVWARGLTGGLNYYRASPLYPPTADDPGPKSLQLKAADFRVTVPTLVVWGEADIALPVTLLDGLDELVDDLTVHRLPRATHWVAHEEPDAVARLIRDFIVR
ncbi:MAG TPA: alpha/beta hydrolase [Burkholderiaceae bacterium]|nr:alpha/beta hydrolase [Burkholderiaceae bacterium]